MFSGLVGFSGRVESAVPVPGGGMRLCVRCEGAIAQGVEPKDSVCINGVCLTATAVESENVWFDVVPETIARSNLSTLCDGDAVNVEYSLRLGDRLGGHFVYGHVDAAASILLRTPEGAGTRMRVALPAALRRFVCEKAFISVDGVSVTVAATGEGWFEVALIPETLQRTTLGRRHAGETVNLEADPLARYAATAAERR